MEKALNVIMDDVDRSVRRIFQSCKSSFGRRSIIGLAEATEGEFSRIGKGGIMCAHTLEKKISFKIYHQFSRFNIKRAVEQMYGAVFMHSLKERNTK